MPAELPTAFCKPIQRPVARGPANVCVTEGLDGLFMPSITPVRSSIAAPAASPVTRVLAIRQSPTPALLRTSAVLYARFRLAPRETQRSSSHPVSSTLAPSNT
jgi:hypothetical protein